MHQIVDQPEEKSAAVVREEVRRAIQRHVSSSDNEAYDRLRAVFTARRRGSRDDSEDYNDTEEEMPSPAMLRYHVMGLLSNVASLNRSCSELVHTVLNSEWLGRDEAYVKLFIRFIGNLAAAHGMYLGTVLRMLVSHLSDVSGAAIPGYVPVHQPEVFSRTHMALRYVLHLIPTGSGALSVVLAAQFPFETDSAKANVAYTQNLIRIIRYAPELQADVLALITEKLVKIDVQIQEDMENFEDEAGEDLANGMSIDNEEEEDDDEDEDEAQDEEADDDDRGSVDVEADRVRSIRDNICKLDAMIDIMFEYYAPPFASGSIGMKEDALDVLLSHFQSIILPTYHSRHTQFLVFHFSQSAPALVDRFATMCMDFILSKQQPPIVRQSAAAYLASFIARGAHVSGDVARDIFDLLGAHMSNMQQIYEPTCRGPDLQRYCPFYTTAQALLYIFCFRWRDLTTMGYDAHGTLNADDIDPDNAIFPPKAKDFLRNAIYSKLNPLKVCSPPIVTEFARIAHHLRFLYVFPILETNKRLHVPSAPPTTDMVEREVRAGGDAMYQLESYFPFDPYQLPRSRRWLEGDYVEWRGVPGMQKEKDESESEEEDDDDKDE